MTRNEILKRLCELSTKIGNSNGDLLAHDCFCEGYNERSFIFDEKIINYIEWCVNNSKVDFKEFVMAEMILDNI